MAELLTRLFGIFAIAGIAVFCLVDALRNIRRGYVPVLPYAARRRNEISRGESPIGFWFDVGLKLTCALGAFLFVVMYCVVAIAAR